MAVLASLAIFFITTPYAFIDWSRPQACDIPFSYLQFLGNNYFLCDVGTQYRSAIFFFNLEQKKVAEKSKNEFQNFVDLPVVTEINEAKEFYLAEDYHQCFLLKRK